MDREDLRDPASERRMRRVTAVAIAVLVALSLGAAGYAALSQHPADHHYRYSVTLSNPAHAALTVRVPLPSDAEWQGKWTTLGEGTAVVEESQFGRVLRLTTFANMSAAATLDTWRDVPLSLTTEGPDANAAPQARIEMHATGPAPGTFVKVAMRESDPTWYTNRTVDGDLFEGWNTFAVRETMDHA